MKRYNYLEQVEKAEKYDALIDAGVLDWEGFDEAISNYYNKRDSGWGKEIGEETSADE